jgi:hypothetical protein
MRRHSVGCGMGEPDAIGYAKFYSRSQGAIIRVYDEVGKVIETQRATRRLQRAVSFTRIALHFPLKTNLDGFAFSPANREGHKRIRKLEK